MFICSPSFGAIPPKKKIHGMDPSNKVDRFSTKHAVNSAAGAQLMMTFEYPKALTESAMSISGSCFRKRTKTLVL